MPKSESIWFFVISLNYGLILDQFSQASQGKLEPYCMIPERLMMFFPWMSNGFQNSRNFTKFWIGKLLLCITVAIKQNIKPQYCYLFNGDFLRTSDSMSVMVDKVHAASQQPKADRPKNQFPPQWPSIAWLHIYDKLRLNKKQPCNLI